MARKVQAGAVALTGDVLSGTAVFKIPNGSNGSAVAPVDLGQNYSMIVVSCPSLAGVPAACSLSAQIGYDDSDQVYQLYEQNDPSTKWLKGSMQVTGSMTLVIPHMYGARKIRLILSGNAVADVYFSIRGIGIAG